MKLDSVPTWIILAIVSLGCPILLMATGVLAPYIPPDQVFAAGVGLKLAAFFLVAVFAVVALWRFKRRTPSVGERRFTAALCLVWALALDIQFLRSLVAQGLEVGGLALAMAPVAMGIGINLFMLFIAFELGARPLGSMLGKGAHP